MRTLLPNTPITRDPDVAQDWFTRFEGQRRVTMSASPAKTGSLHDYPGQGSMKKVFG
ncbi:hypothetical protein [Nocardia sp. A7]|uniref:hypothetical protein n=1 Tax=Nocardia sp. A7 TaxID=2789274 RepID=UPI003979EB9B